MINRENYSVVFMGTPEFAKASLEKLVESGFNVKLVITNPDTLSGRGMKLKPSCVKEYALDNKIEIYQPAKLRNNEEAYNIIKKVNPDFIVTAAYGKILPKEILDIPKYGPINVHGSLLPKYRGSAPVQWAIINGESKTGITTMFMDVGMDTGDILLKEETKITDEDNLETVFDRLNEIGASLLIKTLDRIIEGSITRIKQNDDEATIAPMINREMTRIDFSKNYKDIFNFVRGLSPIPGTFIEDENSNRYKIFKVKEGDINLRKNTEIGKIAYINKNVIAINCLDSVVEILELQAQNSKRMSASSFLLGNKIDENIKFI